MYSYIRKNAIFITTSPPKDEEPVPLSIVEEISASIIFDALQACGVDTSTIHFERTKEYLKFVADGAFCFCRVKLTGRSLYIELSLSSKDIKRYSNDLRFFEFPKSQKRFTRFPIIKAEDVSLYDDLIYLAYVWATTAG